MKPQNPGQHFENSVRLACAILALSVLLLIGLSRAQDIYIYPAKGQSQSQQDRDRYECHSWAVKQTGFDPSRSQSAAPSAPVASNQPMPGVQRPPRRGARNDNWLDRFVGVSRNKRVEMSILWEPLRESSDRHFQFLLPFTPKDR